MPATIVVRGVNWVGDTIMTLPAWRELRRIFPAAVITGWAPAGLAPLLALAVAPDGVISFDSTTGGPLKRVMKMSRRLRDERFEMAVLFQNAFESALTAFLAGIPLRTGFPTDLRGPLLNGALRIPKDLRSRHQVFYYLEIVDQINIMFNGASHGPPHEPDCRIKLGEPLLKAGLDTLAHQGVDPGKPIYGLCPGSVNSNAKRWPSDLWAELANIITRDLGGQVIFLGAISEVDLIEEIISQTGSVCLNLAGEMDMIRSMSVMNQCSIVISNDTGSAHLAVAADTNVLTIFGPTIPGATAPYGPKAHIIQGEAGCSPCKHFNCPVEGHPCMRSVTTDKIVERIELIRNQDEKALGVNLARVRPPVIQ
jgi:heptosyltransferase-2